MTADSYIASVKRKNPSLFQSPAAVLRIRSNALEALLRHTFEDGRDSITKDAIKSDSSHAVSDLLRKLGI